MQNVEHTFCKIDYQVFCNGPAQTDRTGQPSRLLMGSSIPSCLTYVAEPYSRDGRPRNLIDPLQQAEDLADWFFLHQHAAAKIREKAFAQLLRNRQSQLRGNEPLTPPQEAGRLEAYTFMNAVIDRGEPNFRNHVALQTYQKLAMWQPKEMLKLVDRTPILMITPEMDTMSPPEEQKIAFEQFPQLMRDGSEEVVGGMIDFIQETIEG
ncbi:hypothetical protein S7711_06152 [Stachybotrys chartarum IBT 7711]|uniref:Uncharacterized protein n=1 Tax=Stachybotrys chartarum (strain CBS 109288 / IBT 7711) TaxID=1280523 RepID=A0A084B6A2_STACB|nr:hypothetical protein S7711_06152 [Stachybotrys chartarum IBT 7711]